VLDQPPSTLPILSGIEAAVKVWIRLAYKTPITFAANVQGPFAR